MTRTPRPPRWLAVATYRTEAAGDVPVEHEVDELMDLADLIELGPDWRALVDIRVTLQSPGGGVVSIEEADRLTEQLMLKMGAEKVAQEMSAEKKAVEELRRSKSLVKFARVMRGLPPAVYAFADVAVCPWCGWGHVSVQFGENKCMDCGRGFLFGVPEGSENNRLMTYVDPPWVCLKWVEANPHLLPPFQPNETLKAVYKQQKSIFGSGAVRRESGA